MSWLKTNGHIKIGEKQYLVSTDSLGNSNISGMEAFEFVELLTNFDYKNLCELIKFRLYGDESGEIIKHFIQSNTRCS